MRFFCLLCLLSVAMGQSFSVERSPESLSCSDTLAQAQGKKVSLVSDSAATYALGYRQASSNNQDPVLSKYDKATGSQLWCNEDIENNGDDGQGQALALSATGALYAFFTSKGTQSGAQYQDYTSGGWIPNFFGTVADSRDVKVTVVLRIDPATGVPMAGTFVGSKLSNGGANTCLVREVGFAGDQLVVMFDSWFSPVDAPGNSKATSLRMSCEGSSPLPFYVKLNAGLSQAVQLCGRPAVEGKYCNETNATATCPSGQMTGIESASGPLLGAMSSGGGVMTTSPTALPPASSGTSRSLAATTTTLLLFVTVALA